MTNFILFHKNSHLPDYLPVCIKQILHTQTDFNIFLLTDNKIEKNKNIQMVDISKIKIEQLDAIDFYQNDQDPLWKTSFERFFYINDFIVKNKLNNVVHFDNDVLIYLNVKNILPVLQKVISNVGITRHKNNEMVCGFMFIKYFNCLENICNELCNLAKLGIPALKNMFNNDMPHEMRLLGHIFHNTDLLTALPGTPFEPLFSEFNCVFDPSTYGQYFGGTGNATKNTIHPNNVQRIIDQHIVNKTLVPSFNRQQPFITYNMQNIPICNLHIHSKQLQDFCGI
jgi:hypothetical protein